MFFETQFNIFLMKAEVSVDPLKVQVIRKEDPNKVNQAI